MANRVFNVAKGMVNAYHDRVVQSDPATSALLLIILQSCEDDDVLDDYATISTLLASAGNTEADFTNYERKITKEQRTSTIKFIPSLVECVITVCSSLLFVTNRTRQAEPMPI